MTTRNELKRILILGATSGIGRGLAEHYASGGNMVAATGRRTELLDELQSKFPDNILTMPLDVTQLETLPDKLDELTDRLGGLDMVIVSSGTGDINPALDFAIERHAVETNVCGFTAAVDWAFNRFKSQGYGHLAAITSLGALVSEASAPAYNATKAYQANYLDALRGKAVRECKNIYVTDIRPGFVDTNMAKGDGLFWVAPVDKAVRQIVQAVERRKKIVYITRRWRLVAFVLRAMQLMR